MFDLEEVLLAVELHVEERRSSARAPGALRDGVFDAGAGGETAEDPVQQVWLLQNTIEVLVLARERDGIEAHVISAGGSDTRGARSGRATRPHHRCSRGVGDGRTA